MKEFKLKALCNEESTIVNVSDMIELCAEMKVFSELCGCSVNAYEPYNYSSVATVFFYRGKPAKFEINIDVF